MNYESYKTPEIRMAPTIKPINDVPKRTEQAPIKFYEMNEEQLMAFMTSVLRFKYDPIKYRSEPKYKSTADSILFIGMIAMMTDYLRGKGINVEKLLKEVDSKIKIPTILRG